MSIIRAQKKRKYTQIDNSIFSDSRLTLKAKGLLCTMLSNSDEWEFYTHQLSTTCKDGVKSVRSALNELETYGYIDRERYRIDGKFSGQTIDVYELPHRPLAHVVEPHVPTPHAAKGTLTILTNNNTNNNNTNSKEKRDSKTNIESNTEICEEERLKRLLDRISNGD